MTRPTLDLATLAEWNAKNQAAIKANRYRELRERFLDSLYETNDKVAAR